MRQSTITILRDAGAGAGGGALPPSLASLDTPPLGLGFIADPPKPEPPAPVLGPDGKPLPAPEPKLGPDGKVLPPEPSEAEKAIAAQKLVDDAAAEEERKRKELAGEGDDEPDPMLFFEEVEKITGRKIEVEYPDGVTPDSPQGIAVRENVIREQSFLEYDQFLATQDSRAYAYMLHRQAGGSDKDFFDKDNPSFVLPTREELKTSAEMQQAIYKADLKSKGLEDDLIADAVAKAIKENKLLDKAEASFTKMEKADKDRLLKLQTSQQEEQELYQKHVKGATSAIVHAIDNSIGFIIPDTQKAAFQNHVLETLRYDNGQFYTAQLVNDKNLKEVIEALFFQYSKGDLSKIVMKQVQTKAAQSLRLKLGKGSAGPQDKGEGADNKKGFVPLGSL